MAFDRMIPEANKADIGLFVQSGDSVQKRFTLPNKFFEYIQARLALCVADLPEMAGLVERYDLGVLAKTHSPPDIAAAIRALTPERIAHHKAKAAQAADQLNWETESERLIAAYAQAIGGIRVSS